MIMLSALKRYFKEVGLIKKHAIETIAQDIGDTTVKEKREFKMDFYTNGTHAIGTAAKAEGNPAHHAVFGLMAFIEQLKETFYAQVKRKICTVNSAGT